MADEIEQYQLQITAQDQASATINQVNAALTQTLAQTVQLDEASLSLAQRMALPGAAESLHLTEEELQALSKTLGVTGEQTEQLTQKTGGLIQNWLRGKDEADAFLVELEKIQASESAANPTGLLGLGDTGAAIGFMNELAVIQQQEADAQAQITQQMTLQGDLAQRLADSALVRENAETGFVADLRQEAFSAPEGGDAGGGDSGGGFNLTGSRRGLTALGSLAGGSPGLSDAARLVSVTAAFGGFGAALGLGAIALKSVTDAETARTKAAQDGADALNRIAQGAAGGTTESITKQIDQQTEYKQNLVDVGKQLASYNDEVNSTAEAYKNGLISQDEYTSVLHQIGSDVSDLTGGSIDAGTAVSNLSGIITDNQKSVDAASISIGGLHIQLNSVAVAANDAAEKAHKLALGQEADADRALAIDQLTKSQRDDRIAQDNREIDVLTRLVGAGDLNTESLTNVAGRIDVLNADLKDLNGVSETYADTVERQKEAVQALTDANQKTLDLLAQEGDVRDKIANTEADIQQARTDAAAQSQQIQTDEQSKIADIQEQGGEKQAEIVQNTNDAIAKIQRDSGAALFDDVANRDALKYIQDQQKAQQAIADQQTNEKKQLDAQASTETKQIAQAQAAAAKAETNLEQSLAKELASKDRTLQQEQVDLQNILNGELALSQQYGVGIVSTTEGMWQNIQTIFDQVSSSIEYNLNAAVNGGATTPIPYIQQIAPLPAVTGTAAGQNNSGNGARSINMTINGAGMSLGTIINHVLTQFDVIIPN